MNEININITNTFRVSIQFKIILDAFRSCTGFGVRIRTHHIQFHGNGPIAVRQLYSECQCAIVSLTLYD